MHFLRVGASVVMLLIDAVYVVDPCANQCSFNQHPPQEYNTPPPNDNFRVEIFAVTADSKGDIVRLVPTTSGNSIFYDSGQVLLA